MHAKERSSGVAARARFHAGWDFPKALGLLRKSNPPLFEWLQSPIVYRERPGFMDRLRPLLSAYYSPVSCMHHYLSMARGNVRQYLTGEQVWTFIDQSNKRTTH